MVVAKGGIEPPTQGFSVLLRPARRFHTEPEDTAKASRSQRATAP
jgi:hypothetical protein